MVDNSDLYNSAIGKQGGLDLKIVAQIAPGKDSELAFVKTLPAGKYSKDPAEKSQYRPAYKVYICDRHPPGTPVEQLPWAVIGDSCGLRNESSGFIRLPPNAYVELSIRKDSSRKPYYNIEKIIPNYNVNLDVTNTTTDTKPGSGFVSGSTLYFCLLYTSPSPRDGLLSRMPSSA